MEDNRSIRLSTLNPQLREKVSKFDFSGDGSLELEEALAAIITLQKQSNNYKKMLYLAFPLMAILLVCMLGINVLSIKLTKELESRSFQNKLSTVLTDTSGNVVSTSSYYEETSLINWIYNIDKKANSLQTISFGDTDLKIIGSSIHKWTDNNAEYISVTLLTSNNLYITVYSNFTYNVCNSRIENCLEETRIKNTIENSLQKTLNSFVSKKYTIKNIEEDDYEDRITLSSNNIPFSFNTSVGGGFGCTPTKCLR
jgi:hypothetical protein